MRQVGEGRIYIVCGCNRSSLACMACIPCFLLVPSQLKSAYQLSHLSAPYQIPSTAYDFDLVDHHHNHMSHKASKVAHGGSSQPAAKKGNKKSDSEDEDFTPTDEEEEDGLLPDDIDPIHYALHLRPNYDDWTFTARVVIQLRITEETDQIQFNAADLTIDSCQLATSSDGILTPTRIHDDTEEEVTTLRFDAPLRVGDAVLTILYRGLITDKLAGVYRTHYQYQGATHTIIVTQFEACDARRCLPCWDEPARKSTFAVTLTTPARYTSVSNMPIEHTKQLEGGEWNETTFQTTPKMSSYLLCFGIGEFETIQTTTDHGVLVRLLTPRGKIGEGEFSLDLGKRCLEFYSNYFDLPYPLPKLDLLCVPDTAVVAMENCQ